MQHHPMIVGVNHQHMELALIRHVFLVMLVRACIIDPCYRSVCVTLVFVMVPQGIFVLVLWLIHSHVCLVVLVPGAQPHLRNQYHVQPIVILVILTRLISSHVIVMMDIIAI